MAKIKILFVCLGNICRSPLAAVAMQDYVKQHKLPYQFEVDSAGTSAYHVGSYSDPRSIKVALNHGFRLKHKARQLIDQDLEYYDYILVMDHRNYEDVCNKFSQASTLDHVFLLRSFDPLAENNYNVPDPFYGLESDFEELFAMLQRSVAGFINFLSAQV